MEIKREYYLDKFKRQNNGLIKVITGVNLLLDEVQLLDCFEAVLNGYLRKETMDVYVTGSNAKFLSKDIVPKHYDEHGILTMNIYDFLLNQGSMEG